MTVPPVFNRYLEQAMDFARRLVRTETGTRRWATVTAVDPVRITYDGPAPQGIISPVVLGTPVTLGDRVRAHTIHDRTYITRANPTPVSVSVDVDSAYTLTGWRVRSDGQGMATVWGQFNKKTGSVAQGDMLGALSVHVSPLVTGFAQGAASVVTKVTVNGTVLSVSGAPTGSTSYVRVDGLSLPIGG